MMEEVLKGRRRRMKKKNGDGKMGPLSFFEALASR
jgi:hypothetical protein